MEYTELIWNRYLDSFDNELTELWDLMGSSVLKAAPSVRVAVLKKTIQEFSYSSRFMLMRILQSRAGVDKNSGFEYRSEKMNCVFEDITTEHAVSMNASESLKYEQMLEEIAHRYETDTEYSSYLITKAWHTPETYEEELELKYEKQKAKRLAKAMYKTRLTRQEALDLGHVLGFSLKEMQEFLLRVFDTDECFRFTRSDDLIEAYGFLVGADIGSVSGLKEEYREKTANIEKDITARQNGWTTLSPSVLDNKADEWLHRPDDRDEQFMAWMIENAAHLDIPSRSAQIIYRNLLAFVCKFADDSYEGADSTDLSQLDELLDDRLTADARELIPDDTKLYDKEFVSSLLKAVVKCRNKYLGSYTIAVNDNMELSSADVTGEFKKHIIDILRGAAEVEKSDMLYLLWLAAGLCWNFETADESETFEHLCDFQSLSEEFLKKACLPELYYPHVMETSIFLSIVSSNEEYDPSEIYAILCEEAKEKKRESKPHAKKHSEEDKISIVKEWIARKGTVSLDDFAAEYGISPKSVSYWQKALRDSGKL